MTDPRSARIGIVGADAPRQVLLAAGAHPVRLFGSWAGEPSTGAAEMVGAADAVALRVLDEMLAGAHDDLAGVVVCNDSAANLRLFYVLRILSRRGELAFPVLLVDAPRDPGAARERFVARQFAALAAFCAERTGTPVTAETLAAAAVRERALGASLEALRARRAARQCGGSAALTAYRVAATLPPESAIPLIDAARDAPPPGALPIVVTGSSHPDGSAYEAIERAGLVIAAEDHDAGDAGWLGEAADGATPDEVYATLAHRHAARPPLAARSRSAERATALAATVRRVDARGVLALARELDDAPVWDLAAQRRAMASERIPVVERVRVAPGEVVRAAREAAVALREDIAEEAS